MVKIIVAYNQHRVIGRDGTIPWHEPDDMAWFQHTTMGHSVIMGRRTWETLPRAPLLGRLNIVLTRESPDSCFMGRPLLGPYMCQSMDEAVELARRLKPDRDIFIAGGARVYREALQRNDVEEIIATEIPDNSIGDAFFPPLDPLIWSHSPMPVLFRSLTIAVYQRIRAV